MQRIHQQQRNQIQDFQPPAGQEHENINELLTKKQNCTECSELTDRANKNNGFKG